MFNHLKSNTCTNKKVGKCEKRAVGVISRPLYTFKSARYWGLIQTMTVGITYGRLLNFGTRDIIDADWKLACQRISISTNKLFPKEFHFRLQRAATLTQFMFTRSSRSSDNTHRFITKLGANSLPVRLKVTGYSFLSSKRSNSWWMVFSDANQLYCSWYMNKQDK